MDFVSFNLLHKDFYDLAKYPANKLTNTFSAIELTVITTRLATLWYGIHIIPYSKSIGRK